MTDVTRPPPLLARRRVLGLGVLAAVAGAAGWYSWITPPPYAGEKLTVAEAHQRALAGEITLVDIRRPDEWQRTGLGEGAYPLDMRRDDFTQALTALAAEKPGAPIAVICAKGVRSARMANRLTEAGLGPIIDVPEGMEGSAAGPGWVKAGLPTTEWAGNG